MRCPLDLIRTSTTRSTPAISRIDPRRSTLSAKLTRTKDAFRDKDRDLEQLVRKVKVILDI